MAVLVSRPRPSRSLSVAAVGTVAVALALALAALTASTAHAAPAGFVGVQSTTLPSDDDFRRLRRANISLYRHNIVWQVVERDRGRYRWARYDRLFARAAAHGVRVLPVLVGSPGWANRDIHHPPRSDSARRAYYRFVGAVVDRYGPKGSLWKGQPPARGAFAARQVQIWNEPNLPNWWNNDPDPAGYVRLLRGAASAARKASSNIEVLAAGIPESRHPRVMTIRNFLDGVYRVPGARRAFDGIAIHPYDREPGGILNLLERARGVMKRAGDGATPMWVTEFGWAAGGGHPEYSVSESAQAVRLRLTYRLMLERRHGLNLRGAVWYLYRDPPASVPAPTGWQRRTGLFTAGDRPRDAWRAMLEVTGGRR